MARELKELDAQEDENEPAGGRLKSAVLVDSPGFPFRKGELGKEDDLDEDIDEEAEEPSVPISELRKVRAEAAKYRKQLRHLESRIEKEKKAAELAKMAETDRLKAIAEESEAKAKALRKRADTVAKQAAAINAASALGFHNPKDAASLIDLRQIEIDDDGIIDEEKINGQIKSLVESKPYLIKAQNDSQDMAGFGPTNPASSIWPKPKFRTKDQIDRLKQQSSEAMGNGRVAAAVRLYNQAWEMERGIRKTKS